ncbi:hypothetical protein INT47_000852 [Mucor saturninus]|uniref:Uncharacterized protein n=1 Tax=Mucor saturninus TaxID=64648 RepID=A0A8H7V8P8_9FUNG|nr:hypothetical protein INT47_000852 [Mucor saturninus]
MYIISEIFFLVANIDALYGYARLAIFFCLSEFPLFISILLSVLYGHLWTIEKPSPENRLNDDEEYKLEANHNKNYGNENSLVDYDSTDSFLPPPYSG